MHQQQRKMSLGKKIALFLALAFVGLFAVGVIWIGPQSAKRLCVLTYEVADAVWLNRVKRDRWANTGEFIADSSIQERFQNSTPGRRTLLMSIGVMLANPGLLEMLLQVYENELRANKELLAEVDSDPMIRQIDLLSSQKILKHLEDKIPKAIAKMPNEAASFYRSRFEALRRRSPAPFPETGN